MSAGYFAGFAAICGLVIGGLDYHQQSKKSDDGLGLQAYVVALPSRMTGGDAAEATRAFLPDAPEGWVRRALADGGTEPLWGGTGGSDAQSAAKRGWIYAKGDEIIWVEAMRNPLPKTKGVISGMAEVSASQVAYEPEYSGFAVLGGVGFAQMETASWKDPLPFRVFDGWIGFDDEIRIRVRADASDETVRTLLAGIDFDGLNGLLKLPVSTIGNAVEVRPENEVALADQMVMLRAAMIRIRADAAVDRRLNSEELAQLVNSFIENIAPGATLDSSRGTLPDYDDVIQSTYRNSLSLIMENDKAPQAEPEQKPKLTCTQDGSRKRCRSDG